MQREVERSWQKKWSHIHVWWIKIGKDTLGVNDSSPRPDRTAQYSSARKINSHDFLLYKPEGVVVEEETGGFSADLA